MGSKHRSTMPLALIVGLLSAMLGMAALYVTGLVPLESEINRVSNIVLEQSDLGEAPSAQSILVQKKLRGFLVERTSLLFGSVLLSALILSLSVYFILQRPLSRMLRGKLTSAPHVPVGMAAKVRELSYFFRALSKYHRAMMQGYEVNRIVVSGIKDGFQLIDSKERTVEVNQRLCEMIGKSRESFEFRPEPFFYLDADGQNLAYEFLELIKNGDTSLRTAFGAELRNTAGDWTTVTVKMHVIESHSANDYLTVVFVQEESATDRPSELAKEKAKYEGFAALAAGVAHNLNNLLTGIISSASLLQGPFGEPDKATTKKLLDTIRIAADRSADLCKELLSISHLEAGKSSRRPVNISKVVKDAVAVGRSLNVNQMPEFKVELPPEPVIGLCEESALHQVLLNLITNSIDAMPEGGVLRIRTFTTERISGPFVSIVVQDSGSGMTEDVRERVFDAFFTTKKVRGRKNTFGGSGIGLTTALRMVESWGGTLECGSEIGRGSTFTIHIPSTKVIGNEARPS